MTSLRPKTPSRDKPSWTLKRPNLLRLWYPHPKPCPHPHRVLQSPSWPRLSHLLCRFGAQLRNSSSLLAPVLQFCGLFPIVFLWSPPLTFFFGPPASCTGVLTSGHSIQSCQTKGKEAPSAELAKTPKTTQIRQPTEWRNKCLRISVRVILKHSVQTNGWHWLCLYEETGRFHVFKHTLLAFLSTGAHFLGLHLGRGFPCLRN